jgi:hypothetical protein
VPTQVHIQQRHRSQMDILVDCAVIQDLHSHRPYSSADRIQIRTIQIYSPYTDTDFTYIQTEKFINHLHVRKGLRSAVLSFRETYFTHCTGVLRVSRTNLDGYRKSGPKGFENRNFNIVASLYNDYAIPAASRNLESRYCGDASFPLSCRLFLGSSELWKHLA